MFILREYDYKALGGAVTKKGRGKKGRGRETRENKSDRERGRKRGGMSERGARGEWRKQRQGEWELFICNTCTTETIFFSNSTTRTVHEIFTFLTSKSIE